MAHIKDNDTSKPNVEGTGNNNTSTGSFGKPDASLNLDDLKKQYASLVEEIRAVINKSKDKRDLSSEDRGKARGLYIRLGDTAGRIARYSTDEKESAEYKERANKARAKAVEYGSSVTGAVPKTSLDDVKGLSNVKELVKSFIFMNNHQDILKYYHMEGGLGMLMYGAPGTGKTMFAEAVAHELNLPLFIITPAEIFKPHVGESEEQVKKLFDDMDAYADGALLFVDECESIFSIRTQDTQDYKAAVTTELLQRINGFGRDGSKRIMIAATNRPQDIDPAYLRYKRFSYVVHVTPPDKEAKKAIIEHKLKGISLDGVTVDEIAQMTETNLGFYSGADISGICEEACRQAVDIIKEKSLTTPLPLTRQMFENAVEKLKPSITNDMMAFYNNWQKGMTK